MNHVKTLLLLIFLWLTPQASAQFKGMLSPIRLSPESKAELAETNDFLRRAAGHTPTVQDIRNRAAAEADKAAKAAAQKAALKAHIAQKEATHQALIGLTDPATQALVNQYHNRQKAAFNAQTSLMFYAPFFAVLGSAATFKNSCKRVAADGLVAFLGSFITTFLLQDAHSLKIRNNFMGQNDNVYPTLLYALALANHVFCQNGIDIALAVKNRTLTMPKNKQMFAIALARILFPILAPYALSPRNNKKHEKQESLRFEQIFNQRHSAFAQARAQAAIVDQEHCTSTHSLA